MSGWNEDNFLERIACPDQDTLGAVVTGSAGPAVREAVAAHLAVCRACADLELRLRQFSTALPPQTEYEWTETEARLDHWMHSVLRPGAAAPHSRWWDVRSWNMLWLLAPAAALGIATFIVWIRPAAHPVPVETAATIPAPPAVEPEKPAPGVANMSATKGTDAAATPPPVVAVPATPPVESNPAPQPAPESNAAEAVVQSPPPAEPAMPAGSSPTHLSMRRDAGLVPVAGQAPGRSMAPPPAAPGSVRINAGTRVWILLKSTSPQTNGDFKFRGMVLLPVTQAGSVLLDRETEVVGVGKVDRGRTTIRIVEFVWQGARYKLRGSSGSIGAPGPGAGPAVGFNAGQVLETWLAAVSTYERVPGEGAPPQG